MTNYLSVFDDSYFCILLYIQERLIIIIEWFKLVHLNLFVAVKNLPAVVRLSSYKTASLIVFSWTDFRNRAVVAGNVWFEALM